MVLKAMLLKTMLFKLRLAKLGQQKRPRSAPVAAERAVGNAQRRRDLGFVHPAEVAHLHQLRQPHIQARQPRQRGIQRHHLGQRRVLFHIETFVQRQRALTVAAFFRQLFTGFVHQHETHCACDQRHEMTAIVDVELRAGQSQPAFAHQRCRRHPPQRALTNLRVRNAMQIGIQHCVDAIPCAAFPCLGLRKQFRDGVEKFSWMIGIVHDH